MWTPDDGRVVRSPEPDDVSPGHLPGGIRPSALRPVIIGFGLRTTSMVALLTCAYYVWPTGSPVESGVSAARLAAALLSVALVAFVGRAQHRAIKRAPRPVTTVEALLATFYFLVIVFSAVYYTLASSTDQFVGLETKTDGLYFTVTVVATVGFGDIHAAGGAARALVTAQMLFSLFYIGTTIRLLSRVPWGTGPPGLPASREK